MRIYLKKRGCGLTYDLVKDCIDYNRILIVPTMASAKHAKEIAMSIDKDFNLITECVNDYCFRQEYFNNCNIDNADIVLKIALERNIPIDFDKVGMVGAGCDFGDNLESFKDKITELIDKVFTQSQDLINEEYTPKMRG